MFVIFFVKKKTAYEMRISDWSSAVCSSDLRGFRLFSDTPFPWREGRVLDTFEVEALAAIAADPASAFVRFDERDGATVIRYATAVLMGPTCVACHNSHPDSPRNDRSEEHTSELQSQMRNSYAVFCLNKNTK